MSQSIGSVECSRAAVGSAAANARPPNAVKRSAILVISLIISLCAAT